MPYLTNELLGLGIPTIQGLHDNIIERAQRAILKVIYFKHMDFSTNELYSEAKVLTVRQFFVLHDILRKHSTLHLDLSKLLKDEKALLYAM